MRRRDALAFAVLSAAAPLAATKVDARNSPLRTSVEGGELVIRVGVDTLAFSAENSLNNWKFDDAENTYKKLYEVTDHDQFALDVAREVESEYEIGQSLLTRMLDTAAEECFNNGANSMKEVD